MIHIQTNSNAAYNEANAQPMVLWDNVLLQGTLASSTLPTGTPRADALTEATADYWQASAADTFRVTFGASKSADCLFIAAHTLGTAGATVTVQYFNGSTWVTEMSAVPTDDSPMLFIFPSRSATGFGITVSASAQIGVIMAGTRLVIPGGVQPGYTPVWASLDVTKMDGISRRGQFFGQRVERVGARLSPAFMPVDYTFALSTMRGFRNHYDMGNAFAWAAAPSFFTEDVAYVWCPDGAAIRTPVLAGGFLVNLSLEMEAYIGP